MAKVILARESDKGNKLQNFLLLAVMALVGGFGGLPIGAIFSAVMQLVLQDTSAIVEYGFWAIPIVIGMIIAVLYLKKEVDMKNHTVCSVCKGKMHPCTEMDTIFSIPLEKDQTFENPLPYLAQNMDRVYAVSEIPKGKRGCYVCLYVCNDCNRRLVRIADFYPQNGTCEWKESYYFDYAEFIAMRGTDDLV